jgi:hypothetical protein
MPKNGFEPIFKSYKEFVLPIKTIPAIIKLNFNLYYLYMKNLI